MRKIHGEVAVKSTLVLPRAMAPDWHRRMVEGACAQVFKINRSISRPKITLKLPAALVLMARASKAACWLAARGSQAMSATPVAPARVACQASWTTTVAGILPVLNCASRYPRKPAPSSWPMPGTNFQSRNRLIRQIKTKTKQCLGRRGQGHRGAHPLPKGRALHGGGRP